MSKKKQILLIIAVFFVGLIITGGSYAYFAWMSDTNKNIIFNTASNLKNYIVYDEGDSTCYRFTSKTNSYTVNSNVSVAIGFNRNRCIVHYHPNDGTVKATTTYDGDTKKWKIDSDGTILKSVNGGAYSSAATTLSDNYL